MRLQSSLTWWHDMGLATKSSVEDELTRHPLHAVWPMAFPFTAPDGCPVQFARVGAVKPSQLTDGGEDGLRRYLSLWLARALELQAEVERTRHCLGTYDVYDASGAGWSTFDVSSLRILSRCITLGETHFPDNLCAPRAFACPGPRGASRALS